ncbi:MAG TPA: lamin tail domain-containing protein [Verrucomicrobiota bacterium]|nr:hypothetical protein [Verrucomicrobiales bacterium]HRI12077.1 lamin tail domain-containing protein [Verrucomicrobiota bacterium]
MIPFHHRLGVLSRHVLLSSAWLVALSWGPILPSLQVRGATSVLLGQVTQISGPQDLDLDGQFVYAINFSANDPVRSVRGVEFLPDRLGIPGATLVGPQQVTPWQTKPEFGASADANALEEILHDIRWASSDAGERLRATLAVTPGEEYKLQVLISANGQENRRWDIRVNGLNAVDEITSLGRSPGQSYSRSRATLYTYQFGATRDSLVIEMGNLFGANEGGDRNPIWQALTLERVTAPPTPDDILVQPDRFFPTQELPITTVKVADRRFGALHALSLVEGEGATDNSRFSLDGANLLAGPFDFSNQAPGTTYSIRIRATDTAEPARLLEKSFVLTLAEPHGPTAIRLDAASVSSAAIVGAKLGRLSAVDSDDFDQHQFELVPGVGDGQNAQVALEAGIVKLARPLPTGVTALHLRVRATDRAGLSIETAFVLPVLDPQVRLNEILASEVAGIVDESGQPQEWIEVFNELDQTLDLTGWYLTDDRQDLRKWRFPEQVLGPKGFVVVLADGSGAVVSGSPKLHANFSLSASGEWIGLVRPDGVTLASEMRFPAQYPGVAYGKGADGELGFLPQPTPGQSNGARASAGENGVTFSRTHGFMTETFTLELSATIPGSTIRYTLDGTRPSPTSGTIYSGPISISPSTTATTRGLRIVRALAINPLAAYAPVGTQTYLFVNGATGPGVDGVVSQSRLQSSITRHATYGPLLGESFMALPALSVVTTGSPSTTETRTSIELVDPLNREPGFQIDCGLEATGTTSLGSPKLSMAAKFRPEYGQSRLRYPMFARGSMAPESAVAEFKELRLRSHSHDTFFWLGTRENPPTPYGSPPVNRSGDAQLARNPWIDEMQLLMGQPGKHGRQVHLFLNGSYHGIYHVHEHADDDFMASYFPGQADDFHFTGGATTGSEHGASDSWTTAWNSVKTSLANYTQARRWIDVTNLCDYMVLSFYAGNDWDWSAQHNWSAAGPKFPDQGGWKFFQQDSDITLQDVNADCTDQDVPDGIFSRLMTFPDFRILFRDRVYRHCFGDGVLTPGQAGGLYEARMNELTNAIIAETARWQPSSSVGRLPWDRDEEWKNEWNYLRNTYFPQRTAKLLAQFRKHAGWWPMDPPTLSLPAGEVEAGAQLQFTVKTGKAYFTTDGSDPRLPGGAINPAAVVVTNPDSVLTINEPTLVKVRVYTGTDWSALVEAYFIPSGTVRASAANLILSEIHYHPLDRPDSEFLEFLNTSPSLVDLSGVVISNAVRFSFPAATLLPAGERLLVVKDPTEFSSRYQTAGSPYFREGLRVLGPWDGSLSNAGETIEVWGADGASILVCGYSTSGAWPGRADGKGSSLELENPELAPTKEPDKSAWLAEPYHWRPSSEFHGSPGGTGLGPDYRILINEILASPGPGDTDGIELLNVTGRTVDVGGWFLSDSSDNYRKYRIPEGVSLQPGSRLTLRSADFDNAANPACLVPFGLSSLGDDVFLVESAADDSLGRFADRVEFGALPQAVAFGRFPDGSGPLVWLQEPTFGAPNSVPVPGYDAWAATAFPRGTPVQQTAPEADLDADGVSNFAEYAFVTSPNRPNATPVAILEATPEGGIEVGYRRRTASGTLQYRIETSSNLIDWGVPSEGIEITSEQPLADGATLITARIVPTLGEAGTHGQYFRIAVPTP